jgi:hypothetical protein
MTGRTTKARTPKRREIERRLMKQAPGDPAEARARLRDDLLALAPDMPPAGAGTSAAQRERQLLVKSLLQLAPDTPPDPRADFTARLVRTAPAHPPKRIPRADA